MRSARFFFIAVFTGISGWLAGPIAPAAPLAKFSPVSQDGELVLFDAAIHDISGIRNYTASWQKGSDLTPIVNPVVKDERKFAEYTYRGRQGSACSTFWLENVPPPGEGMVYCGIRFTIDYDKDDFAKVSAKASFSDGTSLDAPLTLELRTMTSQKDSAGRRPQLRGARSIIYGSQPAPTGREIPCVFA